ncbi:MAG TPA: hypothetical protein VFH63_10610 [candidate division Zixibacteria bacterium]|nr:hypothetical protein [candidate division Zixibacteria bacterium]
MDDLFRIPRDPHPGEPDELTPDTHPIDEIERPPEAGRGDGNPDEASPDPANKNLDEPGPADRTPRP